MSRKLAIPLTVYCKKIDNDDDNDDDDDDVADKDKAVNQFAQMQLTSNHLIIRN